MRTLQFHLHLGPYENTYIKPSFPFYVMISNSHNAYYISPLSWPIKTEMNAFIHQLL